MVPFAGFNMPVRYFSDLEEHMTVRNGVGVFDVSHMGEFFLKGENSLDLIQRVTSNDASTLIDGQAQYSCLPNDTGGIVDDLIVYKISDNNYMLVVNASNIEKDWNWIASHNNKKVEMTNASGDYNLFAIQGPRATGVLQKLTDTDLSEIKFYHFAIGTFAGHDDVIMDNDAERRCGIDDRACGGDIDVTGGRIARGMVVRQDDRTGAQVEGPLDHLARKHRQAIHRPPTLGLVRDQRIFSVEKQNPKSFGCAVAQRGATIFDDPFTRIQNRALANIGPRQPDAGFAHRL